MSPRETGLGRRTPGWATGAAFGDYGRQMAGPIFFVSPLRPRLGLDDLPVFGSSKTCKYQGYRRAVRPLVGLKGSPDNLYHNNGDGTFTDVSKSAGVSDPQKSLRFSPPFGWISGRAVRAASIFLSPTTGQPNYLYRNEGNGHFKDIAYTAGVSRSARMAREQANMGVALGRLPSHRPLQHRHHPFQQ